MNNQKSNIERIIKIIRENPDLKIITIVDSNICDDDVGWYMASIGLPTIESIYSIDDKFYLKDDNYYDLVEIVIDKNEVSEKEAERIVNNYNWKKVIIIKIIEK